MTTEQDRISILTAWLQDSPFHWQCLETAAQNLDQEWAIGAGFLRNLVWDHLHEFPVSIPGDIDVLVLSGDDHVLSDRLTSIFEANWSVKNQVDMHNKRNIPPCTSIAHAMTWWPERETAIAVTLKNGQPEFIAPYGLDPVFALTVSATDFGKDHPEAARNRFAKKAWQSRWPKLRPESLFTKS